MPEAVEVEEQQKQQTPHSSNITLNNIDLVTSSGYSKNGAISILQRGIRPDLITSFQIADIVDMWSVQATDQAHTSFLFIAKADQSTLLLQINTEITELDRDTCAFCTEQMTRSCANILQKKFICQVTSSACYIYRTFDEIEKKKEEDEDEEKEEATTIQIELVCQFKLKKNQQIQKAFILDNYICCLISTASAESEEMNQSERCVILYFDPDQKKIDLLEINEEDIVDQQINDDNNKLSSILCFSIFKDQSGLLWQSRQQYEEKIQNSQTQLKEEELQNERINRKKDQMNKSMAEMIMDEEDELLYGNSSIPFGTNHHHQTTTQQTNTASTYIMMEQMTTTNTFSSFSCHFWLQTVDKQNTLRIYHLKQKEIKLSFTVSKFNTGSKTLILQNVSSFNSSSLNRQMSEMPQPQQSTTNVSSSANCSEIMMCCTPFDKKRIFLFSIQEDDDCFIYEAFLSNNNNNNNDPSSFSSKVHLKRVCDQQQEPVLLRSSSNKTTKKSKYKKPGTINTRTPRLRYFDNQIAGFNGVFILGGEHQSYFVLFCLRSGLTVHPLWLDAPILSFTAFRNLSITLNGFIYLTQQEKEKKEKQQEMISSLSTTNSTITTGSTLRICTLLSDNSKQLQTFYDCQWTLKKLQLRHSVHHLCYHEETRCFVVCMSSLESTNKLVQLGGSGGGGNQNDDDKKSTEVFEKDVNFILPQVNQFFIQLYTAENWDILPLGRYQLGDYEHVSCVKLCSLPYEGHTSGFRSYVGVTTVYCYNEDVNSRGRVLLLDVIEVEPEPGQPLTALKLKVILEKEQKGPVTCLESVPGGYLLGAVGQKIFIWEYKNGELLGKAFVDTPFYVHKMYALKSLVLIADLHKSVSLIRFQREYTKLSFIAKDKHCLDTYGCEFLVDNAQLAFLATDVDKNLSMFTYENESHDNQGGQWLCRKAQFNVNSHVNSMFRLRCRVAEPGADKRSTLASRRQCTYMTTLDGGIACLLPVSEKQFRRLFILQNALYAMKPHLAGLNPKAFRLAHEKRRQLVSNQKNILDGDLLFEFLTQMSVIERNDIVRKIKINAEQLLDDLTEIFEFTSHF